MIVTCKKDIPFRWVAFAILPWASFSFNYGVVGVVFFFSLKKFIENPAGLTFILSLPGFVSIILGPVVSFISDRIWTRFGRRKPFITTSMLGIMACLVLMPLMPNFWGLLVVYIIYNAFADLNSPMEPLKLEIIPPHERGRATGAMTWCSNLATMSFYFLALGRFDDVRYMEGVPIFGEEAIYWSAGLLLSMMVLLVMLGIKEVDQKSALRGQRLSLRNFFGGLLDRELWPIYMLVVGSACMNFYGGLAALSNLLYTDQWGYTKQEMGINVAVGGVINLFAIGILTVFADKLNRMRAYQTLICISLGCQMLYYYYVKFVLPDQRPTLVEIIVFGETTSILGILTGLVYVPLVYDYIQRNKMGTYNAGANMVARVTGLITLNGVGLFVWGYAVLFQPPAGEMTRVVLKGDQNQKQEVQEVLRAATWSYPGDGTIAPSSSVSAQAWQANGTVSDTGRAWEIRLHDKTSETLATQKEALDKESSPLIADEKMFRDQASALRLKGKTDDATAEEQKADAKKARIQEITSQLDIIKAQLTSRSDKFHDEVVKVLGSRLIAEGDQVLGATVRQAVLVELATTGRPDPHVLERTLNNIRHERSDLIDLRPLKRDEGYGVTVSAILPPGADEAAFERALEADVLRIARKTSPDLFPPDTAPLGHSIAPAITMDLMVLEVPISTYVSPITRVVNLVLSVFGQVPDPAHRLEAIARNLRIPTETNHVRVEPGPDPKTISVTAVLSEAATQAPASTDPVAQKFKTLLGNIANGATLPQTRAFYDRVEKAAAMQRITVAHPLLISAFAPMKYDYMSGYLWMFVMSFIGICITIAFKHYEAKGLIHKRGIEEAKAS